MLSIVCIFRKFFCNLKFLYKFENNIFNYIIIITMHAIKIKLYKLNYCFNISILYLFLKNLNFFTCFNHVTCFRIKSFNRCMLQSYWHMIIMRWHMSILRIKRNRMGDSAMRLSWQASVKNWGSYERKIRLILPAWDELLLNANYSPS